MNIYLFIFLYPLLQYFLPFATDGINKQIELAILRADKIGVKVISLAALNKVWHKLFFFSGYLICPA